jgi:hypothetical protein
MRFDVFISHASEDKDEFVRPLANELKRLGLTVWYDESSLKLGDNLRQKIDEGLAGSDFGVVVISRGFIQRHWTVAELEGLIAREMRGRKTILPIWHRMTVDEVLAFSPILAAKLAARTDEGVEAVAAKIVAVVRPDTKQPISGYQKADVLPEEPRQAAEPLTELLRAVQDVAPLLHKLDEPIEKKDAAKMLSAMQCFFCGTNNLTYIIDKDIRFATDNLLRSLSVDLRDLHYRYGKLDVARQRFEQFRHSRKVGYEIPDISTADISIGYHDLEVGLLHMIEDQRELTKPDLLTLRLNVTLAEYGRELTPKRPYPRLDSSFHISLRALLVELFTRGLYFELPDILDRISNNDIRAYTGPYWNSFDSQ